MNKISHICQEVDITRELFSCPAESISNGSCFFILGMIIYVYYRLLHLNKNEW